LPEAKIICKASKCPEGTHQYHILEDRKIRRSATDADDKNEEEPLKQGADEYDEEEDIKISCGVSKRQEGTIITTPARMVPRTT
jgi:hypothetical protein